MTPAINRRDALKTFGFIAATDAICRTEFICAESSDSIETQLAGISEFVRPQTNWTYAELNEFLDVLPAEGRLGIWRALHGSDSNEPQLTPESETAFSSQGLQTDLLWVSSNIVAYPFKDQTRLDYHGLVKWVAGEFRVERWIIDSQPTFVIERAINERLFVELWDKMTTDQRSALLEKIDERGEIEDHIALASLSGAGALAALSATVQFAGFAFYTTMSTVICTVAGFFGVTLPFAAYTSAASVVAFLAGPWGWALLAVAAAAGIALAGRANYRRTAAVICQIHGLKVAALRGDEVPDESVFVTLGNPLKRQLIGEWDLIGHRETIRIDLKSDNSFSASAFGSATDGTDAPLLWQGKKGEWSLRNGKFHLRRTHIWSLVRWTANDREFFAPASIEIRSDRAILENGPKMKRR